MGDMLRMERAWAFVEEFSELGDAIGWLRGHPVTVGVCDADHTVRCFISLGVCNWEYMDVASMFDPSDDEAEMRSVVESIAAILAKPAQEIYERFEKAGLVRRSPNQPRDEGQGS